MAWLPRESAEIVKEALPELRLAIPSVVVPSRKTTVPVGVPEPGGTELTAAVRVTAWPNSDGFSELMTVVELLSRLTIWLIVLVDVLALKLLSPA